MYWDSMKSCDLLGRGNGTKLSDDSLTYKWIADCLHKKLVKLAAHINITLGHVKVTTSLKNLPKILSLLVPVAADGPAPP